MNESKPLEKLEAGAKLLTQGGHVVEVTAELAAAFAPGDRLVVVPRTSELLHVPREAHEIATGAVDRAAAAFSQMGTISDAQISAFYEAFAAALEDDTIWREIALVNARDVADAEARGRSTTRLVASESLRRGMTSGLRGWMHAPSRRGQVFETVEHDGFRVEQVGAALGVVAFVFEGRPNVLADACGVLRGGNTVVFRIGRDALRTAQAIVDLALDPAIARAGLPEGCAALVASASHAAGWALFGDARLSLAVARGSGAAVAALGGIASAAGIAVSLHGTGGAWIVAGPDASAARVRAVVARSLDRKVCNTLNTFCVPRARADELVPAILGGLSDAADALGHGYKLHVVHGSEAAVPAELFSRRVTIRRAEGDVEEVLAEGLAEAELGTEWEWEASPEITLALVDDVDHAVRLFNAYSPRFVGSLISDDDAAKRRFYDTLDAPFVGDDHTRWVDGQFALGKPELGLSNWQNGRLLGRGAILCGDSVYTVRTRYTSA